MNWFDVQAFCEPGREFQLIAAAIGVAASLVSIAVGTRTLWRWWFGPSSGHRRAAKHLRIEGRQHARLNHLDRAMELYDLSAQLNPRAGETYYLRGLLHEEMGEPNRAIADWKRCVERLRDHAGALGKLERAGVHPARSAFTPSWGYAFGAATAVVLVALAGLLGR